jgi:hypothetical protein
MVTATLAAPVPVTVIVVLDDCDDCSDGYAGQFGADVHFVHVDAHNVGSARGAGFRYAGSLGLTGPDCWYATSDADSRVDADWLVRQLTQPDDMVLGIVSAIDWSDHSSETAALYDRDYEATVGGEHDHVHGANMGFRASTYWRLGGFRGLATGEDVDLAERFEAAGYRINRDSTLSVATSTRTNARAPLGFSHHLNRLAGSGTEACA